MPLEESDSHVKVNWVLVGVVALVCWSSKLTLPEPLGGEETAAAFAMAAEMIPWSDFPAGSPSRREEHVSYTIHAKREKNRRCGSGREYLLFLKRTTVRPDELATDHLQNQFEFGLTTGFFHCHREALGAQGDLCLNRRSRSQPETPDCPLHNRPSYQLSLRKASTELMSRVPWQKIRETS